MFLSEFCCPDCGHQDAFYSRPRNFMEKYLLRVAFLRPFRCADCFRRSYWLYSTPARERRPRPTGVINAVAETVSAAQQRVA
jgi:hypothetical protein